MLLMSDLSKRNKPSQITKLLTATRTTEILLDGKIDNTMQITKWHVQTQISNKTKQLTHKF